MRNNQLLCFYQLKFFKEGKEINLFNINEVIINQNNINQIIFVGNDNCIGYTNDLLFKNELSNGIDLKINCVQIVKEKINKIMKVKFSNFDGNIGILLSYNIFIFFSVEINAIIFKNEIKEKSNSKIVDFTFFNFNNNKTYSWNSFSALFLYLNGNIDIICPFFPMEFSISSQDLNSLKKVNNQYSPNLAIKDLNNRIIDEIESSIKNPKTNKVFINEYLQRFNSKIINKSITIKNGLSNFKEQSNYKNIFVLNENYPFVILRVNENNLIDIMVLCGEVLPIRELKTKTLLSNINEFDIKLFLVENIILNNNNKSDIIIQKDSSNFSNKYYLFNDNNIYLIDLHYLEALTRLYDENEQENSLYKFNSEVHQIISNLKKNKSLLIIPRLFYNNVLIINTIKGNVRLFPLKQRNYTKKENIFDEKNNEETESNPLYFEIKQKIIDFNKKIEYLNTPFGNQSISTNPFLGISKNMKNPFLQNNSSNTNPFASNNSSTTQHIENNNPFNNLSTNSSEPLVSNIFSIPMTKPITNQFIINNEPFIKDIKNNLKEDEKDKQSEKEPKNDEEYYDRINKDYEKYKKIFDEKGKIYKKKLKLFIKTTKNLHLIIQSLKQNEKICENNINEITNVRKEIITKRNEIDKKINDIKNKLNKIKREETNKKINFANTNINDYLSLHITKLKQKLKEMEDSYSNISNEYKNIFNSNPSIININISESNIGSDLYSKYQTIIESKNKLYKDLLDAYTSIK